MAKRKADNIIKKCPIHPIQTLMWLKAARRAHWPNIKIIEFWVAIAEDVQRVPILYSELTALRILTNLDRAALATYCGAYTFWAEASEAIQKYGAMMKSRSSYPIYEPL